MRGIKIGMGKVRRLFEAIADRVPMPLQKAYCASFLSLYLVLGLSRIFEFAPFGLESRTPLGIAILVGLPFLIVFGVRIVDDLERHRVAEELRDAESATRMEPNPQFEKQLRHDIGMEPDESKDRRGG